MSGAGVAYNSGMTGLSLPLVTFCILLNARAQNQAAPETLQPPSGERLMLQVHATGDQIYVCKQGAWAFQAPEAKLVDAAGKQVGRHSAGPTWESSDGSQVKGKLVASAPSPDPAAIPWLLLTAIEHNGSGVMSAVASIQRLHTEAGQAPKEGCDAGHEGAEARSRYQADYYFYSRATAPAH